MTFDTSKNLSSIGALLMVIAALGIAIPYLGLVGLIGLILLLIGLKGLADFYNEQGIFSNALYSVIIAIVGGVVAVATIALTAVSALANIGLDIGNIEDWATLGGDLSAYFADFANFSQLWTIVSAVIVGLIIMGFALRGISNGKVNAERPSMLDNCGLYWHLVDLIWIFLFPLFYLIT